MSTSSAHEATLSISAVARRSGLGAGTIRMWEQRHGFPEPHRTASGHRRYRDADVEAIRRVAGLRRRGLSLAAAIEQAREDESTAERPSIFAAVASRGLPTHVLRKRSLTRISRAIEHEALARASSPVVIGAFQHERHYRRVAPRYDELARQADATAVFADFPAVRDEPGHCLELPLAPEHALGNEWAVVVDAPGYAAALLAWEQPGITAPGHEDDEERRFESVWTVDPDAVRRAARAGAALTSRIHEGHGARLHEVLDERPLADHQPSASLAALTARMVSYLDEA